MNYKLLTFLLSVFVLSSIRATIVDIFRSLAGTGEEKDKVFFGKLFHTGLPDEMIELIARKYMQRNPQFKDYSAKIFKSLQGLQGNITRLTWSPDGTKLALGFGNGTINIFDVKTGEISKINEKDQGLPKREDYDNYERYEYAVQDAIIFALAWSPDGTKLAFGTKGGRLKGGTVKILDMVGDQKSKESEQYGSVRGLAWSPDGTKIVSGSGKCGDIIVWNVTEDLSLQRSQVLKGHEHPVGALKWSPDGNRLASGSSEKTIEIWDMTTYKVLHTFDNTGSVYSITWSPDGKRLTSISKDFDTDIKIWDVEQKSQVLGFSVGSSTALALSPDKTMLALGMKDGTIKIFSAADGKLQELLKKNRVSLFYDKIDASSVLGEPGKPASESWEVGPEVRLMVWNPNGTKLLSLTHENDLKIWSFELDSEDIQKMTLEQFLLLKLLYNKSPSYVHELPKPIDLNVPLHDQLSVEEAQQILSTFSDEARNRIIKWYNIVGYTSSSKREIDANAEESSLHGTIYDVFGIKNLIPYFDGIEQTFVTIENIPDKIRNFIAQRIIADNPKINEAVKTFKEFQGNSPEFNSAGRRPIGPLVWIPAAGVNSVAWSPDGKKLASGSGDGIIKIWDTASGSLLQKLAGRRGVVNSVAWSPDGKQLASGSDFIEIWDTASGLLLHTLTEYSGTSFNSVAWSPDGKQLASGSGDGFIRIWDTASGSLLHRRLTDWVTSVAWSPDGKQLASGSGDSFIRIWDTASVSLLQTLAGHTGWVSSVAWSPDGKQLASGSKDKTIRIWDTASGSLLHTLTGHTIYVNSVAWSSDGSKLASGSSDKTIRIWNAASGLLLQTLTGNIDYVNSVAWSPDGKQLASGLGAPAGANIRIWNLYLLSATDIENITLEQALLLKILYAKNIALRYQWIREKRTNPDAKLVDSIDLASVHDKLLGSEAQRILSTFSDEARNRIIKRYNIVGYTSQPKREIDEDVETSSAQRHHDDPAVHQGASAAAASSSGYAVDKMDTN